MLLLKKMNVNILPVRLCIYNVLLTCAHTLSSKLRSFERQISKKKSIDRPDFVEHKFCCTGSDCYRYFSSTSGKEASKRLGSSLRSAEAESSANTTDKQFRKKFNECHLFLFYISIMSLEDVIELKNNGNVLFKAKKRAAAIESYSKAIDLLSSIIQVKQQFSNDKELNILQSTLYNNRF
jgi:tetratricopeptide (TPR) repeat protein